MIAKPSNRRVSMRYTLPKIVETAMLEYRGVKVGDVYKNKHVADATLEQVTAFAQCEGQVYIVTRPYNTPKNYTGIVESRQPFTMPGGDFTAHWFKI